MNPEPQPESASAVPKPPAWLSPLAVEVWNRNAPILWAVGCLTLADLDSFAFLCEAHQEFHDALSDIAERGLVVVSHNGSLYQNPSVGVKHKAVALIRQFGNDFGMSPAARAGLKSDTVEALDDLDQFKLGG
jgi:P27 family predicted phage terminase small subunit